MVTEFLTLFFAVIGILSALRFLVLKFMTYKEERFTLVLPLFCENNEIKEKIKNLYELTSMWGIHKMSTIAVINYGASKKFVSELEEYFKGYDFFKIIDSDELKDDLSSILK